MENARKILIFVGSALGTAFLIAAIAPDSDAATPPQRPVCSACRLTRGFARRQ